MLLASTDNIIFHTRRILWQSYLNCTLEKLPEHVKFPFFCIKLKCNCGICHQMTFRKVGMFISKHRWWSLCQQSPQMLELLLHRLSGRHNYESMFVFKEKVLGFRLCALSTGVAKKFISVLHCKKRFRKNICRFN